MQANHISEDTVRILRKKCFHSGENDISKDSEILKPESYEIAKHLCGQEIINAYNKQTGKGGYHEFLR